MRFVVTLAVLFVGVTLPVLAAKRKPSLPIATVACVPNPPADPAPQHGAARGPIR